MTVLDIILMLSYQLLIGLDAASALHYKRRGPFCFHIAAHASFRLEPQRRSCRIGAATHPRRPGTTQLAADPTDDSAAATARPSVILLRLLETSQRLQRRRSNDSSTQTLQNKAANEPEAHDDESVWAVALLPAAESADALNVTTTMAAPEGEIGEGRREGDPVEGSWGYLVPIFPSLNISAAAASLPSVTDMNVRMPENITRLVQSAGSQAQEQLRSIGKLSTEALGRLVADEGLQNLTLPVTSFLWDAHSRLAGLSQIPASLAAQLPGDSLLLLLMGNTSGLADAVQNVLSLQNVTWLMATSAYNQSQALMNATLVRPLANLSDAWSLQGLDSIGVLLSKASNATLPYAFVLPVESPSLESLLGSLEGILRANTSAAMREEGDGTDGGDTDGGISLLNPVPERVLDVLRVAQREGPPIARQLSSRYFLANRRIKELIEIALMTERGPDVPEAIHLKLSLLDQLGNLSSPFHNDTPPHIVFFNEPEENVHRIPSHEAMLLEDIAVSKDSLTGLSDDLSARPGQFGYRARRARYGVRRFLASVFRGIMRWRAAVSEAWQRRKRQQHQQRPQDGPLDETAANRKPSGTWRLIQWVGSGPKGLSRLKRLVRRRERAALHRLTTEELNRLKMALRFEISNWRSTWIGRDLARLSRLRRPDRNDSVPSLVIRDDVDGACITPADELEEDADSRALESLLEKTAKDLSAAAAAAAGAGGREQPVAGVAGGDGDGGGGEGKGEVRGEIMHSRVAHAATVDEWQSTFRLFRRQTPLIERYIASADAALPGPTESSFSCSAVKYPLLLHSMLLAALSPYNLRLKDADLPMAIPQLPSFELSLANQTMTSGISFVPIGSIPQLVDVLSSDDKRQAVIEKAQLLASLHGRGSSSSSSGKVVPVEAVPVDATDGSGESTTGVAASLPLPMMPLLSNVVDREPAHTPTAAAAASTTTASASQQQQEEEAEALRGRAVADLLMKKAIEVEKGKGDVAVHTVVSDKACAVIGVSPSLNLTVVSFRGTKDPVDVLTDIQFISAPFKPRNVPRGHRSRIPVSVPVRMAHHPHHPGAPAKDGSTSMDAAAREPRRASLLASLGLRFRGIRHGRAHFAKEREAEPTASAADSNTMEVHRGFAMAFESIRDEVSSILNRYSYTDPAGGHRRFPHEVVFVGHSLGGALAHLAAVYFHDLRPRLVTFAAPATGNLAFCRCLEQVARPYGGLRVWNEGDVVPYIAQLVGYSHAGIPIKCRLPRSAIMKFEQENVGPVFGFRVVAPHVLFQVGPAVYVFPIITQDVRSASEAAKAAQQETADEAKELQPS